MLGRRRSIPVVSGRMSAIPSPVDGVRLHDDSPTGRTGRVSCQLSRILAGRCLHGYDGIFLESKGRIVEVACWAHARSEVPREPAAGCARMERRWRGSASCMLSKRICAERCGGEWQTLTLDERAQRIAAAPAGAILACWRASMPGWKGIAEGLAKSAVRGAMDYKFSNWWAYPFTLRRLVGHRTTRSGNCYGSVHWDAATGFLWSERGGHAAAIHSACGLVQATTARPWVYFRDVLTRLPALLPRRGRTLLALRPTLEAGLKSARRSFLAILRRRCYVFRRRLLIQTRTNHGQLWPMTQFD